MDTTHRTIYIITFVLSAVVFSYCATSWAGGVCLKTGYHTDVQEARPKALDPPEGSGVYLRCKWGHEASTAEERFGIYYNTCDAQECTQYEEIPHEAVEGVANYLQCAWDLFLDQSMAPESMVFKYPLDSPWMDYPGKERIPVWIRKNNGAAGANKRPRLYFPAHERIHDPVTVNAIHEFGHIIVKAYPGYLAGGSVNLVNEGLPTFFEQVLRDELRNNRWPCGANRFIDLSQSSLRSAAYCSATPFWYFISSFSTASIPEIYLDSDLTQACKKYLSDLENPPASGKMKHIVGRDVILATLNAFDECYPLAFDTPACTQNGGYDAYCSLDTRYVDLARRRGQGCQPDDQLFSMESDAEKYERRQARGELAMPLVMEIIDGVIWRMGVGAGQNPRYGDGIRYPMFRHYLEWNYERQGAHGSSYKDSLGYAIKSFGAHYHKVDISSGTRKITLEKGDDLSRWAYGVFYKARCHEEEKEHPSPTGLVEPINMACQSKIGAVAGWNKEGFQNMSGWDNASLPASCIN